MLSTWWDLWEVRNLRPMYITWTPQPLCHTVVNIHSIKQHTTCLHTSQHNRYSSSLALIADSNTGGGVGRESCATGLPPPLGGAGAHFAAGSAMWRHSGAAEGAVSASSCHQDAGLQEIGARQEAVWKCESSVDVRIWFTVLSVCLSASLSLSLSLSFCLYFTRY